MMLACPTKTWVIVLKDDFGRDHKGLVIGCKMQDRFGRLYYRLGTGNGQPMDGPVDRRGEGEPRQLLFSRWRSARSRSSCGCRSRRAVMAAS